MINKMIEKFTPLKYQIWINKSIKRRQYSTIKINFTKESFGCI